MVFIWAGQHSLWLEIFINFFFDYDDCFILLTRNPRQVLRIFFVDIGASTFYNYGCDYDYYYFLIQLLSGEHPHLEKKIEKQGESICRRYACLSYISVSISEAFSYVEAIYA